MVFLATNERSFMTKAGDVIDGVFKVESIDDRQILFTHLPTNQSLASVHRRVRSNDAVPTPLRRHRRVAVALLVALAGCAVPKAPPADDPNVLYAQGRYEEGLQRLKRLSDENPRNVEYRVNYEARREGCSDSANARADTALRQGRLTDAEKAFGQILSIDPSIRMPSQAWPRSRPNAGIAICFSKPRSC